MNNCKLNGIKSNVIESNPLVLSSPRVPSLQADLASLLLRLSQDGHGRVEVCGPPGTAATLHALRHIIRFRHPQVRRTDAH